MVLPIRIVLFEPSHPGNIGAAARAMKTMGLHDLRLVRPRAFPHPDALARAAGADDVLQAAQLHDTLLDAVAECGLVVGSSARSRHLTLPVLEPRDCALQVVAAAQRQAVAVLFGSERVGLTNVELGMCHVLVNIPTAAQYRSLNISMAVQLLSYEIFLAARGLDATSTVVAEPSATVAEMEYFYTHLQHVLAAAGFTDHAPNGHLMARMRRLFNRVQPNQNEVNILRGMLRAVQDVQTQSQANLSHDTDD